MATTDTPDTARAAEQTARLRASLSQYTSLGAELTTESLFTSPLFRRTTPHDLILLVGPPGAGKSHLASLLARVDTEIVSSDRCRALIHDDPGEQARSGQAFDLVSRIVSYRAQGRRRTIVDAMNRRGADRRGALASYFANWTGHEPPRMAMVLLLPPLVTCLKQNCLRQRHVPEDVIARVHADLVEQVLTGSFFAATMEYSLESYYQLS